MAVVDPDGHTVVLSVVYDGPPEAGKTTSVRAVARSFGRTAHTPEEREGRTTFYDWVEHTGGRFQGAPIRCEIVSVPGQMRWVRRRAHFIERADVVVFVGDTRATAWKKTVERLRDLRARLDARSGAPVGIVFQANKRDHRDALPFEEVQAVITSERIALVESVAHDGSGVREAFVCAVRLALDRVREEQERGRLPSGSTVLGDQNDLLSLLRPLDMDADTEEAESVEASTPARVDDTPDTQTPPPPPSPTVPSGCVWPPVEGRVVLGRIASSAAEVSLTPERDWVARLRDGWLAHSWADAVRRDLDEGRKALIAWARLHTSAAAFLSQGRCIALCENGAGSWRLWQIIRPEPSVRDLADDLSRRTAGPSVVKLASLGRLFAEARRAGEVVAALPCTVDTVGANAHGRPLYVGLVPPVGERFDPVGVGGPELADVLRQSGAPSRFALPTRTSPERGGPP